MRNSLGQALEVGSLVLVTSQGQGWVESAFGRIEKFSKSGFPQVRYDYKHDGWRDSSANKLSPPLQRYERIVVIPQNMYDELVEIHQILAGAQKEWSEVPEPERPNPSVGWDGTDWAEYREESEEHEKSRKEFINAAMNAAGKEDYYD